jgi:hypothetical protein
MRTTIDIPDETYRTARILAAERGDTLRQVVLEGLEMVVRASKLGNGTAPEKHETRPRFPVIRSKHPGSLKLGEEGVYEYIPFP